MNSLLRNFTRLKVSPVSIQPKAASKMYSDILFGILHISIKITSKKYRVTSIFDRIFELVKISCRDLSLSQTAPAGRYHRIEGFSRGGRKPWKNGYGMNTKFFKWNRTKSETALRIKEFKQNPSLTHDVETVPMFWMLRPLGDQERDPKTGELIKESNDINVWVKSTWKRGMEDPRRFSSDGPNYRLGFIEKNLLLIFMSFMIQNDLL